MRQRLVGGKQTPATLVEKFRRPAEARPDVVNVNHPLRLANPRRAAPTEIAIRFLRFQALPDSLISRRVLTARLADQPETRFAYQKAWLAHLDRLGFTALDVTPDPVRVATEGALWGSVQSHKFLGDAVVLSDDVGQFNVARHALCWVHAERLVHKLDAFTDRHCAAQTRVRGLIWNFYASLKAYRLKPSQRRAVALRARFGRIFLRRTDFVTLDRLLARQQGGVVGGSGPPGDLHTNGSENDIRCYVTHGK